MTDGIFIGIGFGTLNSSIAIIGKSGPETIANEDGDRNIPSYVAFTGYEELIGSQAKVQAISNAKGTIVQFRNLLGLSFDDHEVQHHCKTLSMSIVQSESTVANVAYEIDVVTENEEEEETQTQQVSVTDVCSKYLRKLKETAENYLGKPVKGAVVSVPAHFAEKSRDALLEAGKLAGFERLYPVIEPVAAALAFDNAPSFKATIGGKKDRRVLVVDLGGHQFNVTLLSANRGLYSVVSSLDDYQLGGSHFDELLVGYVGEEFRRKTKADISKNRRALAKLRLACESAKRMLSQKDTAPCSVDSLYDGIDYHGQILKGRFEMLAEPLFQRCLDLVKRALAEGGIVPEQVDEVLFVGGSTRMPRFQAVIKSLFPETTVMRTDIEPDEAVGLGTAAQASLILSADQSSVNFDEISTAQKYLETSTLTASIGLATADGSMAVIIPKRAPIPTFRTIEFANSEANQKTFYLAVYEGENTVAKKNELLAEIVIHNLPESLAVGQAKIDVTFLVDKDEILTVLAKEKSTGHNLKVRVTKH